MLLSNFDPADYLRSEEDVIAYLNSWFDGSASENARALGDVARSRGMSEVARKAGVYMALSENGNPTLETLTAVLSALGLELTVQKRAA